MTPSPRSSSSSSPSRFPFLSLPSELRNTIYTFALSLPLNKSTCIDGYTSYTINPTWFLINRQIHSEATHIFRKHNIFVAISTPWGGAHDHVGQNGFVPILIGGEAGKRFTKQHLEVAISSPEHTPPGHLESERFIILLDDLEVFCDFWFYQDLGYPGLNRALALRLVIKDPYAESWDQKPLPRAVQRRMIEPFGVVRGLHEVKIVGEYYPSIEETMREKWKEPINTPEQCIEEAVRLKDEGNELLQKGLYREALRKYEESFFAIHILIIGRRRSVWADAYFHVQLGSGANEGQHGHFVRIMLRCKLVANTVMAYLQLKEYEEAFFWGKRTIDMIGGDIEGDEPVDFPAIKEIGKIYYRTAKAAKELGKEHYALKYFRVSRKYLRSDIATIDAEIRSVVQSLSASTLSNHNELAPVE